MDDLVVVTSDRYRSLIYGSPDILIKKGIVSYKIIDYGLRRESKFIGLSSKLMVRPTQPTKYKILLSP